MWTNIRMATDADVTLLERKAREFIARHDEVENWAHMFNMVDAVRFLIEDEAENDKTWGTHRAPYLRRLWKRVVARALKTPGAEGIAYGTVGYHTD